MAFFLSAFSEETFWQFLKLSLSVSKSDFLYIEYSLSLFCIADIISVSNQGFEFAFTLTFLIGATKSIPFLNLFIKSAYPAFTEIYFK